MENNSPIDHVAQEHLPKVQQHPPKTVQPVSRRDASHSTGVDIIEFGPFSPYKSHLSHELSDEIRKYERGRKRALSLKNWKWDDVIAIDSSEDTDLEDDFDDTADCSREGCLRTTIEESNEAEKKVQANISVYYTTVQNPYPGRATASVVNAIEPVTYYTLQEGSYQFRQSVAMKVLLLLCQQLQQNQLLRFNPKIAAEKDA